MHENLTDGQLLAALKRSGDALKHDEVAFNLLQTEFLTRKIERCTNTEQHLELLAEKSAFENRLARVRMMIELDAFPEL